MKQSLCLVAGTSLLLLVGCGKESPPATSPPSSTASPPAASGDNPVESPGNYLGSLANAQKSAVKTVDLAALEKAIELFQVDKGRLPKDLNELVAGKFIPQIPSGPAGMKIVYDPATGTVKVAPQ